MYLQLKSLNTAAAEYIWRGNRTKATARLCAALKLTELKKINVGSRGARAQTPSAIASDANDFVMEERRFTDTLSR